MSSEKKTSPVAYVLLFLATAVTGSVLSFLYLWINSLKILPIDWLYVLLAVAIGAAMGFVSTLIVKLFKIKSMLPAIAMVVLGCLAFTYFKWALYVAMDANREFNSVEEDFLNSALMYQMLVSNDFTDANGQPYTNLDEIISDMQNFSAYDYGILNNEVYWWLWDVDPNTLSRRDIRDLQSYSYYDWMGYSIDFGTNIRLAVDNLNDYLLSSGYTYIEYYLEHGETPTVAYYATRPAKLFDVITRINNEGRWSYDERDVTGVLLWIVWIAEFFIICGYAVVAAPKAINKLNNPPPEPEVFNYDNPPPADMSMPMPAAADTSGWGNEGFGATGEIPSAVSSTAAVGGGEQYDEHGRPIAKADEFGRMS
jgi:hypothetical protein